VRAALKATRAEHTKKASSSELKSISRVIVAGCRTQLHLSRCRAGSCKRCATTGEQATKYA
jgi:hypothetical protein